MKIPTNTSNESLYSLLALHVPLCWHQQLKYILDRSFSYLYRTFQCLDSMQLLNKNDVSWLFLCGVKGIRFVDLGFILRCSWFRTPSLRPFLPGWNESSAYGLEDFYHVSWQRFDKAKSFIESSRYEKYMKGTCIPISYPGFKSHLAVILTLSLNCQLLRGEGSTSKSSWKFWIKT